MTNKEFFKAIVSANLSDEITAKAQALLDKEVSRASKRSSAQAENRNANIELAKTFAERIGQRTLAASEIFELVKDLVPNVSKVSAVCRVGVDENIFEVTDGYKVGGKGRAVKGYTPIQVETETEVTEW